MALKWVNGVAVEMKQSEIDARLAEEAAAAPLATTQENAAKELANNIVFRALIEELASRFGVTKLQLVNSIKARL